MQRDAVKSDPNISLASLW